MGWWDNFWASGSGDDPLRKLDPKLREFLERESPVKYGTPPTTEPSAKEAERAAAAKREEEQREAQAQRVVPRESQFQDGRYAHLWKTYRPLSDIEAETKTDHEKLMDVLDGYKERKSQIGKAALENCALEQVDWRNCMNHPTITERMTMCRDQIKKFERCYMMQTRLLKTLGYLSVYNRSPEIEEDIQMHADTLYHRLLAQEAEIAAAKQEGRPIPQFPPLIPRVPIAAQQQQQQQQQPLEEELTKEQQEFLKSRLQKVAEEDKAAEEEAIRAEWRAKAEVASQLQDLWKKQEQDKLARKERGEETMWDKVTGVFSSGK